MSEQAYEPGEKEFEAVEQEFPGVESNDTVKARLKHRYYLAQNVMVFENKADIEKYLATNSLKDSEVIIKGRAVEIKPVTVMKIS